MGTSQENILAPAEKSLVLEEHRSPSQTEENDRESVVRVADEANLDGGENEAKPEEQPNMGDYMVWNYLIPNIAFSLLTTRRGFSRRQPGKIELSS